MTITNLISYILSIVVLGIIAYQDYSKRMIHVFLFPLLSFILLFPHVFNPNIHFYLRNILINISFVVIIFIFLFLYLSLRNLKFTNFINKQIGLGDFLMLGSLCFWGNPLIFIRIVVFSILFSLILSLFVLNKKGLKTYRIPLAAHVSLFWIVFLSLNYFYDISLIIPNLPL